MAKIIIKNEEELEGMRAAGRVAATVRRAVAKAMVPGITTQALDEMARDMIADLGGKSAFFGYCGFPAHTCISVNDEVVHGIPGDRHLEVGDIISLDVGVNYKGFIGDNAETVMLGVTDPDVIRLVETTRDSLMAAIDQAVEGNRLGDISHAVQRVAEAGGFSIVKEYVGHGVGRTMHEEPQIPNYGRAGSGPKLKAGMTLAIEPMVNLGSEKVETLADKWTVRTVDRKPSVHWEHTIAVGKEKAEILTLPPNE